MSSRLHRTAALLVALGMALALPAAQPSDPARAAAELKALNARILRRRPRTREEAAGTDRVSRKVGEAEGAAASAQGELRKLRNERNERAAARKALETERAGREAERQRTEADLEKQLRAAYL